VLARILGFSPGFLVGLVVGLEIASQISRGQKLKATAVQLGVIVGLAIAAWLGYSLALVVQGDAPLDFTNGLIQDALTAVVSEGLTAAFIGLLPLTYFDGKEIFDLSKKWWVALYLFVGIPFALLVLPSATTGQSVGDLLVWTLVMLGFTLLTFMVWGIARWRESRSPIEEAELVDAE